MQLIPFPPQGAGVSRGGGSAVAAARDRERVQFRDGEFQLKRARAAAAAQEEEEEERRRAAALQAIVDSVAPAVEADLTRAAG